jgi:hypothetical protein
VCGFVVTVGGGRERFAKEKTAKKEACRQRVLVVGRGQPKRMLRASGQTYVRQVLPPTFYSFELVAVSHCFSRHHV